MKKTILEEFYSEILNTARDLSAVFEKYLEEIRKNDLNNIQQGFHQFLAKKFEKIRLNEDQESFEEKLDMPTKVAERVQITTLLFIMMNLGAKYSYDLYQKVLKMRKELAEENLILS